MAIISVGRTKHSRGGYIQFATYENGGTAMRCIADNGEPQFVATVNMAGHKLPPNEVWIKNWSENEGVAKAFEVAGIIKLTGRSVPAGFATALHAEIIGDALAALNAERALVDEATT